MACIGLFGGTFNPIHNGHLKAAEEVLKHIPLDFILFIPSYIPPHKNRTEVVTVDHRLNMVRIACRLKPEFKVSEVEARSPGPSYSIITLRQLKKDYPGDRFFFIVGSDAFLEIETWKDYNDLLIESSFVIVSRPGFGLELLEEVINKVKPIQLFVLKENSAISIKQLSTGCLYLLETQTPDISSTEIRKRLRAGLPISGLVPPGVEEYIKKHKLYL